MARSSQKNEQTLQLRTSRLPPKGSALNLKKTGELKFPEPQKVNGILALSGWYGQTASGR
jgi:hypothetical protein